MKTLMLAAFCLISVSAEAMDCNEYQHQLDLISAERQQDTAVGMQHMSQCVHQVYMPGFNPDGSLLPESQKEMDKCNKASKRSSDYAWSVYEKKIKALDKRHPEAAHCKSE